MKVSDQRTIARALVMALFITAAISSRTFGRQAIEEIYTRDTPIPKSYKSWSLFLVCSQQWLLPQNKDRVRDLYDQFRAFGGTIGGDHAAIWFWVRRPNWATDTVTDNVDVERNVTYCKRFNLPPSEGPWLFWTTVYPDGASATSNHVKFGLNKMSPAEITGRLDRLGDDLLLKDVAKQPVGTEGSWRALRRVLEEVDSAKGFTFSFVTEWFRDVIKR